MDAQYVAAIFDEKLNLYVKREALTVFVEGHINNHGLAEALAEDFYGQVRPRERDGRPTGYAVRFQSRKSLLRLCNVIEPHTIKKPIVRTLRDTVHTLYHNRDKEARREAIRFLWKIKQKWIEDG
jgi:hypothetical protein